MPLRIVTLYCFYIHPLNLLLMRFTWRIMDHGVDTLHIILEAGVVPSSQALYIAIREEDVCFCQLLVRHGANPFLPVPDDLRDEDSDENDDDEEEDRVAAAASPFQAAARLYNILIFDYFLDLWNSKHCAATTRGRNASGDYPLHVICRDPHVSLQVILLMVARHADAVTTLSGQEHLLPFQIAAMANADLDVIFYLMKLCPDALRRFGLLPVADPVSIGNHTSSSGADDKKKPKFEGGNGTATIALEDFNALRAEKDAAVDALKSLQAEIVKLQQDLAAATTVHADKNGAVREATTQRGNEVRGLRSCREFAPSRD
jgi:hypothetical protein